MAIVRPQLMRLAVSPGPTLSRDLWKALSHDDRRLSLIFALEDRHYKARPMILRKAAEYLKKRPQAVSTLPIREIANAAAHAKDFDDAISTQLLRLLYLRDRRPMLSAFLDSLGIDHRQGLIEKPVSGSLGAEDLSRAADTIWGSFPDDDVVGYLTFLRDIEGGAFGALSSWLSGLPERRAAAATDNLGPIDESPVSPETWEALHAELTAAEDRFRSLGEALSIEADRIKGGARPSSELVRRALRAEEEFETLFRCVVESCRTGGVSNDSISSLRSVVEAAMSKEASLQTLESARAVASEVWRLEHQAEPDFPSLRRAREDARSVLQALGTTSGAELPSVAERVLGENSPLAALVALATKADTLSVDRHEQLFDIVSAAYGRQLAIAAGRLTLRTEIPFPPLSGIGEVEESEKAVADNGEDHHATARVSDDSAADREDVPTASASLVTVTDTVTTEPATDAPLSEPLAAVCEPPTNAATVASEVPFNANAAPADENDGATAWSLVEKREYAAVAHIGRSDAPGPDASAILPLARMIALAQAVLDPGGELAIAYKQSLDELDVPTLLAGHGELFVAHRFLLLASALRPTILAPMTGAGAVVEAMQDAVFPDALRSVVREVWRFSTSGLPLTPETLGNVASVADWESQMSALREAAQTWLASAQSYTTTYQAATAVWRRWVDRDGVIIKLLQPVISDHVPSIPVVKDILSQLDDAGEVERLISVTQRELGHRKREPIQAKALMRLQSELAEAGNIARQWLDLRSIDPRASGGRLLEPVLRLRRAIVQAGEALESDITAALREQENGHVQTALRVAHDSVNNLRTVFESSESVTRPEPTLERVLNAPLLRVAGVYLDEKWAIESPEEPSLSRKLSALGVEDLRPWPETIRARLDEHDFLGAALGLEAAATGPGLEPPGALEELRSAVATELRRARSQAKSEAERLELSVEQALAQGAVNEEDRDELLARLAAQLRAIPETQNLRRVEQALRAVDDALENHYEIARERLSERLRREGIDPSHPEYAAIVDRIKRNDILAGEAFIELALGGESPADTGSPAVSPLRDFLSHPWEEISSISPAKVLEGLEAGTVATLQFHEGKADGSSFAATQAAMRAWFRVARNRTYGAGELDNAVAEILAHVGFEVAEVKSREIDGSWWSQVHTAPLRSATECPVPQFGSQANGKYEVLWAASGASEREIADIVASQARIGSAVIVICLRSVTEAERRQFRGASRDRRVSFLLLDESLMLFLATLRQQRLSVFFGCTLPFTILHPYHTSSGEVPPELFVGRHQELKTLADPNGQCFVYGGRQLGKTALLRDVERRFHNPRNNRLAIYIDLKSARVGVDRPADALWSVLGEELRRLNIPESSGTTPRTSAEVSHAIEAWLSRNSERHLLLLLDEADLFFEKDGRPDLNTAESAAFAESGHLKGLMEKWRRRFKVVFAGLHNVQRMTQLANHPLVHLGDPVCIGPLVTNGESRDAAELITRPLGALGYEMSPALVSRILMQTNYYPNLIQRYCAELIKHVTDRGAGLFGARSSPPYEITDQQVQEAYRSQELRARIRDSFALTLNLDPRYKAIALSFAFHLFNRAAMGSVGELTTAELRELAMTLWPDGFARDNGIDTFRALLDEMMGLGILRSVGDGAYAFRSANVQLLMGTEREINAAIDSLGSADIYQPFAPAVFRRSGTRDVPKERRSPLTAQQEAQLRAPRDGVTIVAGSDASGLADFVDFIDGARDASKPIIIDNVDSLHEGLADSHEPRKGEPGTRLVVVTSLVPWRETHIHDAIARVNRSRARSHFTHTVFLAAPENLWQLLTSRSSVISELTELDVGVVTLQPWHEAAVRQWIEDLGRSADSELVDLLRSLTGYWPALLYEFAPALRSEKPTALMHTLRNADRDGDARTSPDMLRRLFGLGRPEIDASLNSIKTYEAAGVTPADLPSLVESLTPRLARDVYDWADLLGIIRHHPDGTIALDAVVSRALVGG